MTSGKPPEGPPEMEANAVHPRRGCSGALVGVLAVVAVAAVFVFFKSTFRPPVGARDVCLLNIWYTDVALQMYADDNDDRLPPAHGWLDRLDEYVKSSDVFECPEAKGLDCAFAYNAALGGASLSAVADPEHTIVVFESDVGWNAHGGPELLPDEPRHLGGDSYGFADLSVQWLPRKQNPDGTWAKEPDAEVRWEVEGPEGSITRMTENGHATR
jgi:hypothetical protein